MLLVLTALITGGSALASAQDHDRNWNYRNNYRDHDRDDRNRRDYDRDDRFRFYDRDDRFRFRDRDDRFRDRDDRWRWNNRDRDRYEDHDRR